MLEYFETERFSIGWLEPAWRIQPTIYILEPQRLFGDMLAKTLARNFDVVGFAPNLDPGAAPKAVDLVLIDTDAFGERSERIVVLAADVFDSAALCLLSMTPPVVPLGMDRRCYYLSKSTTQAEFACALREVSLRAAIEVADWEKHA